MEEITIKVNKTVLFSAGFLIVGVIIGFSLGGFVDVSFSKKTDNGQVVLNNQPNAEDTQPTAANVTMDQIRGLFDGKSITFGKNSSKLIFVEISDPSCPYCQVAAGKNSTLNQQAGAQFTLVADGGTYVAPVPEMKKMVDQGKAAFVWIYANGHSNGEMGAKALYCANEKGKFWQAHDMLMSSEGYDLLNNVVKSDKTKSSELANFLKSAVGFDMKSCLDSGKYDAKLSQDMVAATQLGFGGTPYFFVNTANFEGAYNFTAMKDAIDAALK